MEPLSKGLGFLAQPMTPRRLKAAGRLARMKTGDAVVGAARGAGQAVRYANTNATPLLVGGSIGGGATMAGMQMNSRRKAMSKADAQRAYVTGRLSKGLSSALRPAAGKLVPAMRNPAVRARVEANTAGRASGFYRSRGMGDKAAQRARLGQMARFNSSGTFRRAQS